jgi:hypothetical protein
MPDKENILIKKCCNLDSQFKIIIIKSLKVIIKIKGFKYHHRHLRTNRLSTGPYLLPRLQEIAVTEATTKIMAPHTVPKQNQNKNIPMA